MDRMTSQFRRERLAASGPTRRRGVLLGRLFPSNRKVDNISPLVWGTRALEATVLCLLALAFSTWVTPDNPFQVRAEFPWLWIVPAVIAMRYGTSIGIWSVTMLLVSWFVLHGYGHNLKWIAVNSVAEFPESYFVGGLVLIMICGQFSDTWSERHRRLMAANSYFNERLQTITRNHFLLRLSHERLEQDMLVKPMTLRETLVRLRDMTRVNLEKSEAMPGANDFLQILAQSCQLEVAAIYRVDLAGNLDPMPVAQLGQAAALERNDPLVKFCLQNQTLAHLRNTEIGRDRQQTSRYLVCAPIAASNGNILGIVAIERLPFSVMNNDTLQMMAVMVGYYADGLEHEDVIEEIHEHVPDCPTDFALDLVRLSRIYEIASINSAMVALVFEANEQGQDLYENVKRMKRSIDMAWAISNGRNHVFITLLPLSAEQAVEGYLQRIETNLQTLFGKDFMSAHVASHAGYLRSSWPVETLGKLLEQCNA